MRALWSLCSWSVFAIISLLIAMLNSSLKSVKSLKGLPAYFGISCGQDLGALPEIIHLLSSATSTSLAAAEITVFRWLMLNLFFVEVAVAFFAFDFIQVYRQFVWPGFPFFPIPHSSFR